MFLLSFVKGSKSAEGVKNPLADMDPGGPNPLADMDQGGGGSISACGFGPGGPNLGGSKSARTPANRDEIFSCNRVCRASPAH